jgi:hypothetical protein
MVMESQNHKAEGTVQSQSTALPAGITRRRFISRTLAATGLIMLSATSFASAGLLQSAIAKGRQTKTKFKKLQQLIKGRTVTPQDPDFNQVKQGLLWNQLQPQRSPDVIVQANKLAYEVVVTCGAARQSGKADF